MLEKQRERKEGMTCPLKPLVPTHIGGNRMKVTEKRWENLEKLNQIPGLPAPQVGSEYITYVLIKLLKEELFFSFLKCM